MSKPKSPPPPDPRQTSAAATSTNVGTSVANAIFNNTNQITPQGEVRYDQTGDFNWHDPYTNVTYNLPRFTATQILSEQQRAINAQNEAASMNLAGMANYQSGRLSQHLATDVDLENMPQAGEVSRLTDAPMAQNTFGDAGPITRDYGANAGDITRSYGPEDGFSADRQRVEEALMGRLNPQLESERRRIENQMAQQGIRMGGTAYNAAFDPYNRQANDARLGVIASAGQEQQRMTDMAAQRAGFENAAQAQAFGQQGQRAAFQNAAQSQDFSQQALRGQFANQALAQNFGQQQAIIGEQNTARSNALNETYAARNQPINEISALMSGSQVQQPNFLNIARNQIPTTDVGGLINNAFQQRMDIYKQESANHNAMMGGLMSMAGGMMKMSDIRTKEAIEPMGRVFGVPMYEYSYKGDPQHRREVGPMAQDVEQIMPSAVKHIAGIKHIDMAKMGSVFGRAAHGGH